MSVRLPERRDLAGRATVEPADAAMLRRAVFRFASAAGTASEMSIVNNRGQHSRLTITDLEDFRDEDRQLPQKSKVYFE
ncbi:hypothetical protein [Amycolatopsis taiwanensis]|uniref:Uncharacterized protein n=1 Tax=Amycolatopsis taiwanensis TaxID=342230 RepID=A0A9W6QZD8_9PSEU|nr:hypothetical protein [Amycolatopsis taiwanensis]GLY64832.1 hypothetical protein Atai01_14510 [Amycolatopsis taiwanensis]